MEYNLSSYRATIERNRDNVPEAISKASSGPWLGKSCCRTSRIACLFLSAAEERITVTDDISVSWMLVSVAMVLCSAGGVGG